MPSSQDVSSTDIPADLGALDDLQVRNALIAKANGGDGKAAALLANYFGSTGGSVPERLHWLEVAVRNGHEASYLGLAVSLYDHGDVGDCRRALGLLQTYMGFPAADRLNGQDWIDTIQEDRSRKCRS